MILAPKNQFNRIATFHYTYVIKMVMKNKIITVRIIYNFVIEIDLVESKQYWNGSICFSSRQTVTCQLGQRKNEKLLLSRATKVVR